jgi:hypothetical protein
MHRNKTAAFRLAAVRKEEVLRAPGMSGVLADGSFLSAFMAAD